ncbi:MAG TPA: GNAT family N-acetyltransferase [Pyrinomonadaceae bacterium]|jgi:GNAT superfamily N-acetyltransferase|nr:GNAT family N-acetyltransferase [Pyrinomonadaceae bacterium]
MQSVQDIEIRLLSESDIPAAMKLKEAAGWNQTEDDWRRLISLEPAGCFAAIRDHELVGTTTTTTYKDQLAWVGMVLVDPQNRRQGIATRLMETALDYLRGRVATVKLDATAQGKPVYERFGFEVESLVERWVGTLKGSSIIQNYGILNPDTLYELLDLDRRAFNADRSMLIQSLINDSNFLPVVKKSADGKLTGYALARPGTRANYLGPICVTQASDVESLIDEMLRRMGANRVYIDFNRECGTGTSVLSARGFVKERDLIRMTSGERGQKTSPFVVAIAGPEIG